MQAVYLLLLLVAGISAKPLYKPPSPSGSCGSMPYCQLPASSKFAYQPGQSYTYQVKSSVKTQTTADSKQSGLQVSATAKIGAIQNCELELELSNIDVTDEKGNKVNDKKFTEDLKIPLRFEWNDGRVGDVCPTDEKESQWSLNYKRSVLSALQNSMDTLDAPEPTREIDATGDCWAHYEVESSDANRKVIIWTKDLNQCADRQGGVIATHGVRYTNPMSDINTMPLTEGKQVCKQTTEKRIIKQVECKERLEFLPSRLQENPVKVITEATMELKFVSESSEQAVAPPCKYVTSIKFDHSYVPANTESEVKETEALLDKMCSGEVVPESGRDYSDLVDSLRSLNKEELNKIYETASKCKATVLLMQHIIPDVATKAAAQFMIEKAESKAESLSVVRENYMAGLRGVLDVPAELLEKAAGVVTSDKEYSITGRGYLGVGSFINNFCMRNKECEKNAEVKKAVQRFANQLEMCKSGSSDKETIRRALYSLRALGNAGPALAGESMPEIISQCMSNTALPAEIRLSALTVMRRVPCGKENEQAREVLRTLVRSSSEDTEFRSYALLGVLRCAELRDLEVLRAVITDKTNPVSDKFGAFIISSISRMEESPIAFYWTPEFRSTLGALMSTREAALLAMKVDPIKTGGAIHRQHFWSKLNTGYMYDINLIHSEKSAMPRVFHLNLTTGAFGYALNPFEIGIRQEGLESLADNLPSSDLFEKPKDGLLPRFNLEKLQPVLEKLKLSFFVRVFGSEVRYSAVDKEAVSRLRERLDERFNMDQLKSQEGHQGAEMFIDRALSLPTISGLPLRLAVRGTYRSQVRPTVQPEIKRDADNRMTSINLKADVKTAFSVELRASMAAYIGSRQYGIQTVTRFNTKVEYKPELQWEGTHLKLKVDMPSKTIRSASLSTQVFIRHDKTEEPIVVDAEVKKADWCTPGQGHYTGIKMCVHTEVPSRWNGIMTPGKLSYELVKVDEKMRGHELVFQADHTRGSDGKIDTIDFTAYVDAPEGTLDRKLLAQLKYSRPQSQLTVALETPWKKANLEAKRTTTAEGGELKATFSIGEDGPKRVYSLVGKRTSGSVTEGGQKHPKHSVTVEITRNDLPKAILKGSGMMIDSGDLKEISVKISEMSIPNYYTLPSETSLSGDFGKHQTRGRGFSLKGKTPVRDFETEFGMKAEPDGKQMTYSHRLHYHSKPSGAAEDKYDRTAVWEVEFKSEPEKLLLAKSVLRTDSISFLTYADHRVSMLVERPSPLDIVIDMEAEVMKKRFHIGSELHRQELSTMRSFKYDLTVSGFNMIDRTVSIKYERQWEPKRVLQLDAEIRRGDVAVYHVSLYGRRDAPGFGELKFRTFCPYSDFLLQGKGEKTEDNLMLHSLRLERNGDLRFNFESRARITEQKRDVEAKIELMGMVPVTLISSGKGSIFDGDWKGDAVLAYGPRKLLFGGYNNYHDSPKGDMIGELDCGLYFGTPERMFKQYVNWYRYDRFVKVRGMTEVGDDLYKLTGELDLDARRHRVTLESPRSNLEVAFGRLDNQKGYDLVITHRCPAIEFQLFSKFGLSWLRSDLAGHFMYKLPSDEVKKVIGFKHGYNFDFSNGLDLGYLSGFKVNNKEWFVKLNATAIPSKVGFSVGLGNGDLFRHMFTVMTSYKWEKEHVLRIKSELEFHCTAIPQVPRLKYEGESMWVMNKQTGKIGYLESHQRFYRGERELWYRIEFEGWNPMEAMTLSIVGDSEYTKTTEVKVSYTATMPTITFLVNLRYGERAGSLRGLIDVHKADNQGVDISYTIAGYSSRSDQAEVSVRGKHSTDSKTFGRGFFTVEIHDMIYSINSRWTSGEKHLAEIVVNTPHEGYTENIFRIWSRGGLKGDYHRQMLVKIGSKQIQTTGWRKVEPTTDRGESKIDIDGRIYALGYTYDHPENNGYGEYRLRTRIDTPFEGFETSSFLFWISPASKGMKGIQAVWGMTDAYPDITEQRTQLQMAYQVGDNHKGGVMMSTVGKRNYETKKIYREASWIVKFPHIDFTFNAEGTFLPEKSHGWAQYNSQRFGMWRSEWSSTGNMEAGSSHIEIRGKTPGREEPVIMKLTVNHQEDKKAFKKDINGQITTNIPGYELIKGRYSRGLDDEENIAATFSFALPQDKKVEGKVTFGFTPEETELSFNLKTPFETVRELGGELKYNKEPNKHTMDIKFNRNERKYVAVGTFQKEQDSRSAIIKIETPFEQAKTAALSIKSTGDFWEGTESVDLTVNEQPKLHLESAGRLKGENKWSSVVVKYDKEEYKFVVNKEPGKFEIRLPTWWSCIIHYTGKISVEDDIFFGIQRHHTCSPYSFAGNVTISMVDTKKISIKLDTPIPYFKTFSIDVNYNYDESVAQIDQKWPPIGLDIVVDREGKQLVFHSLIEPEEKKADIKLEVRGITLKYNAEIGKPTGGHIEFSISGPVSVNFNLKREGPWVKPDNCEASFSAFGLDLYSLNGHWDLTQWPVTFTSTVDGVIYSKQVKFVYAGETRGAEDWKRTLDVKVGPKTSKTTVEAKNKKLTISYENNENKKFTWSGESSEVTDASKKTHNVKYELTQSGFSTSFKTATWTSMYTMPTGVDFKTMNPNNAIDLINKLLESMEWNEKLVVDGADYLVESGKLNVVLPKDTNTLIGMKFNFERTHSYNGYKRHVIIGFSKPDATPTKLRLLVEINDEKKIDMTGSLERRESFAKYFRIKADFEAPRKMSFDVERDGSNPMNRVWTANVNMDKNVDKVGSQLKLTVQPADGVSARGADIVLTCKRGADEMYLVELGYTRSLTKAFLINDHFYFKSGNMDKKWGFASEISYENNVFSYKTSVKGLTRDVQMSSKMGYTAQPLHIFLENSVDYGLPEKYEYKIELKGDTITGTAKHGDKVVSLNGHLTVTDRHNYELDVKMADGESHAGQITFKKTWSEASHNRTYHAMIKTNNGEIEWFSHRYLGDKLKSRGMTLRIRKPEWTEDVVCRAFGEVDLTVPSVKVNVWSPFHNFDYTLNVERRDDGVKEITGRLRRNDGKVTVMKLELDPSNWSFDFESNRTDATMLKVHGHVASTKYSFLEAKRINVDGTSENLVRYTANLDPSELHINIKYNPQLSEIIKAYVARRREQYKEIADKYKENVPKGLEWMRDIMMVDVLVLPFAKTMHAERKAFENAERAKWLEIIKVWYESPEVKAMIQPIQLPPWETSMAKKILSGEPLYVPGPDDFNFERGIQAIAQNIRQFLKDEYSDMKELMSKEHHEGTRNKPVTGALIGVRNTMIEYVSEVVQRLRNRSWTSCLIHQAKLTHQKLAEKLGYPEHVREFHERLYSAYGKFINYLKELKERYTKVEPAQSAMDYLSKTKITYENNQIDIKIPLPQDKMRSLRTPSHLVRTVEGVRELMERGIAAVKARLVLPSSQATMQRVLAVLQYFRVAQLKYLIQ